MLFKLPTSKNHGAEKKHANKNICYKKKWKIK